MKHPRWISKLRDLRSESGQTSVLIAVMFTSILGMTGFSVDAGRVYFSIKQLQTTTDAAALAGANNLAAGTAVATATSYSAVSGNKNARASLPNVSMMSGYPKILCLNSLTNQGMSCSAPANGNAVQVKQQMQVPLIFMSVLGKSTFAITTTATAAAKGSQRAPYNVAIIVDTTGSMNSTDSDSQCNDTRLNCALGGIQVLLQNLTPCSPTLTSCGTATNGDYANPVDRVALYTFPSLASQADAQHEYDCGSTAPQVNYYTDGTGTAYTGPASVYKILDYSSDYKTSPNATTLNQNSNLVKAVHGVSGCAGMRPMNMYTYIAGAMYSAGYDLINLDAQNKTRQGVVVILTDGDMNTPAKYMPNASTTSGTYASTKNQCQQAIDLASYANYYNVKVYSVAYGATDSGCSTDASGITPCQTVQSLASSPQNFYSDYTSTGGSSSCISAAHSTANLNQIFQMIANDLSTSRLIPDNTT